MLPCLRPGNQKGDLKYIKISWAASQHSWALTYGLLRHDIDGIASSSFSIDSGPKFSVLIMAFAALSNITTSGPSLLSRSPKLTKWKNSVPVYSDKVSWESLASLPILRVVIGDVTNPVFPEHFAIVIFCNSIKPPVMKGSLAICWIYQNIIALIKPK